VFQSKGAFWWSIKQTAEARFASSVLDALCAASVVSTKRVRAQQRFFMRKQYKREDLGKGVRGKHFAAYSKGTNLVLISPDLAAVFPTAEAVNNALRSLLRWLSEQRAQLRAQADAPRSVVVLCRHPGGAPLSASVRRL
jgi:hypothetical protein